MIFMGLAYDPMHLTTRRKNSLCSNLPKGGCRSHKNEDSYFTLGLQRAQCACLQRGDQGEEEEEEGKQCDGTGICPLIIYNSGWN